MNSSSPSNDQLLSLIARDLPGWTLAPLKQRVRTPNPNIRQGPSLANLAKNAGLPEPRHAWLEGTPSVQTFRVMPIQGGPEKVAELRNGRIQIVQG